MRAFFSLGFFFVIASVVDSIYYTKYQESESEKQANQKAPAERR